ncbi:MAG: hemerythrin domain-containing protein [Verrucomicrobia bacterium]|nr:hemerythrin domain-containing protein [Verrucomicrobiota bacterium]
MKVTDVLASQHTFLRSVFEVIERAMHETERHSDVAAYARLLEGLLRDHAEAEENLLFRPLDIMLTEKGGFSQFYSGHQELDHLLKKPQMEMSAAQARNLLHIAFRFMRSHFESEELMVIPLAEEMFQLESLETLGQAWMRRHTHPAALQSVAAIVADSRVAVAGR